MLVLVSIFLIFADSVSLYFYLPPTYFACFVLKLKITLFTSANITFLWLLCSIMKSKIVSNCFAFGLIRFAMNTLAKYDKKKKNITKKVTKGSFLFFSVQSSKRIDSLKFLPFFPC